MNMSVFTVRLPDSKPARLKEIARARGISTNKFIEELTTIAIVQQDMLTRFTLRASRGDAAQGLAVLDELETALK
jgi:predicted transcriptional regulator